MEKSLENPIKKRIHEIIKPRGLKAELAKMLGFERGSISDMLKKPGDPGIHYVQAVSKLTGKSVHWILTGNDDESEVHDPATKYRAESEFEKMEQLIASQKKTIALLEKEVKRLEHELKIKVDK